MWDLLEENDIADDPRPVHHRIPNFKGSLNTGYNQFQKLSEFQNAQVVKVNPDTPQKGIRLLVLEKQSKQLIAPSPRLLQGFFSKIDVPESERSDKRTLRFAATSQGAKTFGRSIPFSSPEMQEDLKVDLVVIGSVAVDPETGGRIGKGEGFAELEYGVLRMLGCIDENTPVVTFVHDCQVIGKTNTFSEALRKASIPPHQPNGGVSAQSVGNDILPTCLQDHDVCVDKIITPTRVIETHFRSRTGRQQPSGIYWHLISPQKFEQIPLLKEVRDWCASRGMDVTLGPDGILPKVAVRNDHDKYKNNTHGHHPRYTDNANHNLKVSDVQSPSARMRNMKTHKKKHRVQ